MKSKRQVASPSLVGRVTPSAPRLPPAGAKFPRRRLPDPLPIKTLIEFPVPTSKFGLNNSVTAWFRLSGAIPSAERGWGEDQPRSDLTAPPARLAIGSSFPMACFQNGWNGRPARPGWRPANRNGQTRRVAQTRRCQKNASLGSVRRVAGRHRPVACATQNHFENTP